MNRKLYDLAQLAGLALVAGGAGLSFGLPTGMIIAGAGLIVLPLVDALIFRWVAR